MPTSTYADLSFFLPSSWSRSSAKLLPSLSASLIIFFVIATANSVEHLPPELVRKGRFDEIFFVDLPDLQERIDIWSIHLQKRSRGADQFDLQTLAMASDGLSGAEIEQAIIAGLYEAFDQNRPLSMEDLLTVLQDTVPLSRMMEEEIEALRLWARQRARRASANVPQ